jgi:hypothetical protein
MPGTMLGQPISERVLGDPGPSKRPTVTKDAPEHRIDDGLPSEADISGARDGDVARRVFHAIAQGLRGFAGQSTTPFRSNERELRERREQGLTRQREMKAGDRQEAARMRAEERQSQALDAQMQRGAAQDALRSRQLDIAERGERRQGQLADAQLRYQQARTQSERDEAMREMWQIDPESRVSATARQRFIEQWRSRPPSIRQMYGASEAEVAARIRGLSAADIAALEDELPSVTVRARSSLAGVGSGGSGLAQTAGITEEQRRQGLLEAGRRRGLTDEVMAGMDDDDLSRAITQDELTRGSQQRAQEYGERLMQSGLSQADESLRAVEDYVTRLRGGNVPGQGPLDTVFGMRPEWSQSTQAREFRRRVRRLLDSQLRAATGANAPDSEVRTFREILGVSDTSTDEDLLDALSVARDYVNSEYNALRGAYGREAIEEWQRRARETQGMGTQAAVQPSRGTAREAPPPPSGRRIRFTSRETGRVVVLDESDPRVATLRSRRGRYTEEPLDAAR